MNQGWQPTKAINTQPPTSGSAVSSPKQIGLSTFKENGVLTMWYIFDTPRKVKIYDISYDSAGYPLFLIYINEQWVRKSAKYFRPIE